MKIRLLVCFLVFISFRGYGQCTLTATVSQSSGTICSGEGVVLTATPSAGTPPYTYTWSTGETKASITVNKPGTYTVLVGDNTSGCQPVKKSVTVSGGSTPDAPTAKNVTTCAGSTATLTATDPGGTYQWYDAPTGGNFLFTGATYTTPPITSATTFYVQTTIGGCTSQRTPVNVNLTGKPNVTGAIVCQGNVATLMAAGGDTYTWYSDAGATNQVGTGPSFTTPVLTATKTYYVVVTSNGCTSNPTPVVANVTQPPAPPTAADVEVCSGSPANLHADAPAGIFDWFTTPTGGTSLISSPDYTTPPLTANTTYYVQTSINDCVSPRVAVRVIVDSPPQPPVAQTDSVCYNSSITLTATTTPSGTYKWYDAASGGNLLATGTTYTTPSLTTSTSYFVQANNGACTTGRVEIDAIVKSVLASPTTTGALICSGSTAVLKATSAGGTYKWYAAAAGGAAIGTGPTFTTPALTVNTTYYVDRTFNGCVSPRVAATVTILPPPAPPTAANQTVCAGSSAILTANSPTNIYAWYDSPTGGTLLSSGQVYVTPALTTTTTYYVETANSTGCTSTRKAVTVNINSTPVAPTASDVTICPATPATLTASAPAGTIQWYAAPAGGPMLASGNTYVTPSLSVATTYYVQAVTGTCVSSRTPVTVNINTTYYPEFKYSSGTYCTTSPNEIPVINNPAGGTFSATPAGLIFVSTTTGEINVAASTPGRYTISFTNNAPCPGTSVAKLDLVVTPDATFTYASPFCQGGKNPLPAFGGTGSPGTFTASPAGLVFLNSTTGEIDLSKSAAGTYTVTNTIVATGTCPQVVATSSVTINSQVTVIAGPNQVVPNGSVVQLAGSITGGVTTGTWTGGTGTFSNIHDPTATYTPGAGETVARLTLTSDDPPGICGPQSDKVIINFNNSPSAPVAAGQSICSGTSATLSATAPGGSYEWYDAASSGTLQATGPSFTTSPLTANTTYYVQTTLNGVTSGRTAVLVTVNPPPTAPVAPGTSICAGTTASLTASGTAAGTYQWYDSAVGGNLLSNNSTYTTNVLNVNTSFYVQVKLNGCISPRTEVDVVVSAPPVITSDATGNACSGNALNYTITTNVPTATFNWSRAAVKGISNPAVTNQTSPTIGETLINTGTTPVKVIYVITASAGSCAGTPFNYAVTVYPHPVITSKPTATICDGTTDNYAITFSIPGETFTWSRDAVDGISNVAVSGQASSTIKEVLFNTSDAPINVTYVIKYKTSTCDFTTFNVVMTVNPTAIVTSAPGGIACSEQPQDYEMTSNISNATFTWSRNSIGTNAAKTNQNTGTAITETLVNPGPGPLTAVYTITPSANGCAGTPFKHTVTINPTLAKPPAHNDGPVCVGSTIHLTTIPVANATYLWTGPNGYSSTEQNPVLKNVTAADMGAYTLVTMVKGCTSDPTTTNVNIYSPSVADAGPSPVIVCKTADYYDLQGSITGGTVNTGVWNLASGTFQDINNPATRYYFSAADKANGSVTLTLMTTTKSDCAISTSDVKIIFGPVDAVNAGPDQEVCSQDTKIIMAGSQIIKGATQWTTGTDASGTFDAPDQLNAAYTPSAADIKQGFVHLVLTYTYPGQCYIPSDTMEVKFLPPPTVNAGGIRYVLRGNTITLNPTVSDNNVTYKWTPDIDISDVNIKNPVVTGDVNRFYILTVTNGLGCVSSDTTLVVVSPAIKVNNTFTPNGDGINDLWEITGLIAYNNATVDIYNRYGIQLFHSVGYPKAWDGTYDGKPVPAGVYYYIINTKVNNQVLSGYVTVIR